MFERLFARIRQLDTEEEREKSDFRSPLTYFMTSVMLGFPNVVLFFPGLRESLFGWVAGWNFVMLFVLTSMLGQLRFP